MAQLASILLCAAAMTAIWTLIGLPIATRMFEGRHAWLFAPALGWAVHSVIALPLFEAIGMNRLPVVGVTALLLGGAVAGLFSRAPARMSTPSALTILATVAAAILALGPMAGILPKPTPDGVMLASPIFDHSKIAMVDEMIRSGVPVQNPFFSEVGAPDRVAYYYLWHFSAAVFGVLTGASGWEADAALTWFTAFASLMVMIGLSLRIGGQPSAAIIAVLLAATASLRTTLQWMWPDDTSAWIGWTSGFGGWLFQTSWAPQHVASAMCVVVACVMLPTLADRRGWFRTVIAGVVAAAAFQSSVWVGGIVFTPAALAVGVFCLWSFAPNRRAAFAVHSVTAAAIAMMLALPFAYDQLSATAMRGSGMLVAIRPVSVLGTAIPETMRRLLDLPAYWLVYLPVEFPAFYVAGIIGLCLLIRHRNSVGAPSPDIRPAAILAGVSLVIAWLLASTFGDNNDLGWRAILPAIMVLVPAAAAVISAWPVSWSRFAGVIAAGGLVLSAPEVAKIVNENVYGLRKPSGQIFSATPSMWQAVRRHTPPGERVLDNPLYLADMTPWPVNISWALLADRRSCYAGSELAIPFAPISVARRGEIERLLVRIFAGEAKAAEVGTLAKEFRCDTIVVTAQDGAWQRDPFASGEFYRLVESQPNAWRIYRKATPWRAAIGLQMPLNQLKPRSDQ